MRLYEYECTSCRVEGEPFRFDAFKPIEDRNNGMCPKCGKKARKLMSVVYNHWPQILTEQSHHKGAKDEWVPDKPSNDMIVDNTKAPYTKTVF